MTDCMRGSDEGELIAARLAQIWEHTLISPGKMRLLRNRAEHFSDAAMLIITHDHLAILMAADAGQISPVEARHLMNVSRDDSLLLAHEAFDSEIRDPGAGSLVKRALNTIKTIEVLQRSSPEQSDIYMQLRSYLLRIVCNFQYDLLAQLEKTVESCLVREKAAEKAAD